MTEVVLSVSKLGKVFYSFKHEFHRVLRWFSFKTPLEGEKWVLKDVSFDVEAGQALAIVGRNGAGKSTMLKLITGTMRPSTGAVQYKGSISAILELGMGFNPDYTGRQNVFHSLGLMGYQHADIVGVLGVIEDFSELGEYFDKPLRIYSSGMQMRLAFSVATAFRPDILIVDEALSVGDTYFQHKSFERIREFRKLGTTLILVSHDRVALLSLCDRAILLHEGSIAMDGEPETVLDYYNALLGQNDGEDITTEVLENGKVRTTSGSRKVTVSEALLLDEKEQQVDSVTVGQSVILRVKAKAHEAVDQLVLGFSIKDRFGQTIHGANSFYSNQTVSDVKAGEIFDFHVRFPVNLGVGTYSIAIALVGGEDHIGENYEWRDLSVMFDVANLDRDIFDGSVYLPSSISIERKGA